MIDTIPPVDRIVQLLAAYPEVAAPVVALLSSWVLYGVLGKRYLGADDDYWPALRSLILPVLDRVAAGAPGLYARGETRDREVIGFVRAEPDDFDQTLEDAGFHRNPLASFKTWNGRESQGSWAYRYGTVAGGLLSLGSLFRRLHDDAPAVVTSATWFGAAFGRFCAAAGEVFARRQVHAWYFTVEVDGKTVVVVCGHDEYNALNPLTALLHLRAVGMDISKGTSEIERQLESAGATVETPGELAVAMSVPVSEIRPIFARNDAE